MLNERQLQLVEAIINEYIKEAEPVGSVQVVRRYRLGCSPATIRNEMAKLLDLGYLEMMHTSSGRVPTKSAYRLYLDEIMHEEELPVLQEVAMKQRLWSERYNFDKLLRETVKALAENIGELAVATSDDGYVTYAGTVNILDSKEFWDIDAAKAALTVVDNFEILERIFGRVIDTNGLKIILEDEIGVEKLEKCGFVAAPYKSGNKHGHIAVFGPSRMNYSQVIPALKYAKQLVQELGESW